MPIIKSAKKRVKVATKARLRNSKSKRAMREAIKAFSQAVGNGKSGEIAVVHKEAVSAIDQAVKKNLIHKNKAARLKSRLSAQAKAAGVKQVDLAKSKKHQVKTTPVKKPAAKPKAVAKKTLTSPAKPQTAAKK